MSEDTDVAPEKLPRYSTNVPYNRKSSDKNVESFTIYNGGPGASVLGSISHNMNQTKPIDRPGEDRSMAGNKSNMPHISRSRAFRESFNSGGYSVFTDFDSNNTPMFEITPISAGDFKLSDSTSVPQNEVRKPTLTETIVNLGIDAIPVSEPSKRGNLSTVLNEFGFNHEPNKIEVPDAPAVDSWFTNAQQENPANSNSRQKQRARSEPAWPRKAMTLSEEFSENIMKSLRSPGAGPEIKGPGNPSPPLKLFDGSTIHDQPGHFRDSEPVEKPDVYLHTLDSQIISVSDTRQKPKGKRKRPKPRNPECFIPILTANMDNTMQTGSSPEKHCIFRGDDHVRSLSSPAGTKFNDSNLEKLPPQSPKKSSPKRESMGTSPRNKPSPRNTASPKGKPQEEPGNKSSPPNTAASGRGEGSPSSPKGRSDISRSRSQDSPKGKRDSKSPPYNDKKCELKIPQQCHRRSRFCGRCYRPAFQGNLFKNIAQAFGCQLTCIANCNQRYQGFPGIQGLYTPEVEVESLFNQQPYVVCEDYEEARTALMKEVPSAPRRHGTPAFYSNRRHSLDSFRYRGAKAADKRQRGVSQQTQQGRRLASASERRYQSYGNDYLIQDNQQLRFELKQTSQSSVTSVGDNFESSQSTEPPDEHSLAESRHSGSKLREHPRGTEMIGSETRMQRSGTDSPKKYTDNVSPRSFVSEDDDHSIISRKSARSTERRSKHDVRQSRRSAEVSQRLDMIPRGQVSFQAKKQISSESEDRLQSDSGESITSSEKHFLDRTRQVLEESFKGPHICSRRYPMSERVVEKDDAHIAKSIQRKDVELSEQQMREEVKEKKRSVTLDDEFSVSERKPVTGRRTVNIESRRAHRTQIRDKSQEYVLEASRPPVVKEECKYVEEKSFGDEHKDVYSVGDRMRDGGIGLYSDPRSEIQSSINTNIQVYTTLCSHGNAPLNVEDCARARAFSGNQDFKDNEQMSAHLMDWTKEPDSDHILRQSSDSKRSDFSGPRMEETASNIQPDSMTRGAYSDISRSNLAGRRPSSEVPHHDILYVQTASECPISNYYLYDRSGSGHLRMSDDRRSELEHRKPSQTITYERNRAGRIDDRGSLQEESKPEVSKLGERSSTTSDQEYSRIHGNVKDSDEYTSRQNQQSDDREIHSSFERRSRRHDSDIEAAQRPAASTDSCGGWRELNVREHPVNGTSSKPPSVPHTDCSSEELTIASCVEGRDPSARKLFRRSKELREDDLRASQGVDKPPCPSKRQPGQGYRERSELRPTEDECPERGSSSKKVRGQCTSKTVEHSCTESEDNVNSRRATETQERSSIDSKHSGRHRRSKRDYDSAYDDDMDEGVSQEDASTSISRQLPVEDGLQDTYYDHLNQGYEYEGTSSLRERTNRSLHFGEVVERKCHSERLSARSSSFKYEASKRLDEKHGSLDKYSAAEQKGKTSGVRVKSTSSRSSHTINSREEEEIRVREATIRGSLVTMRENKRGRGSRDLKHKQKKPYSSADTRSTTFETGNESHDDEDSENTLPASPGDLESEYLDEETEDRARAGKHRTYRGGATESDLRKLHGRTPPGRQDSQDESHNSSSCRTTPLEDCWEKLRAIPSSAAKANVVGADKGVKKYLEFLVSKSTVAVERESQNCEQFHSDSCMERRCLETRSARNRHRTYCDGNSGVHQTDRLKSQPGYVHHRSQIRTKSPKFQYYRRKSPQKAEDDDDEEEEGKNDDDDDGSEDDIVMNKTTSRSNSSRYGKRSRRCREGTIDLFEQIIIPEQPLQVDEYHNMHSFKNSVPFFCESLRVSTEHPESRKDCAPQSELSKSVILPSSVDVQCLKESVPPQMYTHSRKSQLSSYTDSLHISPAEKTKPVSSGRHSIMHLKSLLLQSGKEKIQIYSHRRAEKKSATTTVRQTDKISRKVEFDVPKDAASSFSSECPNIGFEHEVESVIRTGDASKEDNRDDLVLSCNVVSWGGNKNFSSNAERDRNSSSGNGDSWYPEYAYRCGVIDTLRILDSDLAISTPSAEFIHPCQKIENTSESCMRHHQIEDHLTYIMQSFPSLALCKQNDETFEIIRQNSLRALVYAAKLSVDWPAAHFYDKNTGNLENWIREVKEYSSGSNVSSLTETYSFDVQTENEKLRAAHKVANKNHKCHVQSKSLNCSIYQSPSSVSKVLFRDVRIDEESVSSPDHFFGDVLQNSGSEQLEDSVALTEHERETPERKGPGVEHSDTTAYLSDSDSHVYTEQGSNSDVTPSADHSGHKLEPHENYQHTSNCLCKKNKSNDSNHEGGIITKIQNESLNADLKNPDSWRVRLHKAQLSPNEEDRLRSAISRKLGSQQTFALIPVSFSESLMSTVQGACSRSKQSREKCSNPTSSCVVKQGRYASDKDIQEIFDDICETHLNSPHNTMAFYVVAVDKQRKVDDEMRNNVQIEGEQSHVTSCISDGDGKHKKYYIYTKEELVKAVANSFWEKCDLVKPTELQHLQASVDSTPNYPDHCCVVNHKHEAPAFQSSIHRIPQSVDTHNGERAQEACKIKPSSQGDYQTAGRDFVGVKNHHYLYNTSRDQSLTKEQSKQNSGKGKSVEKQESCESGNSTFIVLNSNATSPSYTMNTHSRDEDAKKSKEVTNDYSANFINKYKHKLETGPSRETREHGATELVSRHLTAQNMDTSYGCQSKERKTLENEPGLEKLHRIHTNNYTSDIESTSESPFQNHPGNLSYNDLDDNYKYSEQEECNWLTNKDKICRGSPNANKNRLRNKSRPSERRESCLKSTNNLVHETAATNKCSSSISVSGSTKLSRKSKSYSDLHVSKVPDLQHDDCENEKKKRKVLSQHKTLSLLETLVDGQLIAFFNNALKKITSPKHTICLRIDGNEGKIRGTISNQDPHDSKQDCNLALSSEEDEFMTSPSAASATETMTEKSLTEESVVILSLPAESRDRRKRITSMSPVTKKQRNEILQEWINNSTPDVSRLRSKSDKHKEKYVLSVKRKRLIYKGRKRYRCKRRANIKVQSSESENITNSANDGNESEASDIKYYPSPSRSPYCTQRGRNKRLRKPRTPDTDNNHSPCRRASGTAPRSRHRRDSRKPAARSETRCKSSSRPAPGTRGKRIKNCSLDSRRRKSRSKEKTSHRGGASAKSVKMRNEEKPVEVIVGKAYKENKEINEPPLTINTKTFSTSGISRIARALNGGHLQERKNVHADELCDEGRSRHSGPNKYEGGKRLIKRDNNGASEKGEVRIPISDEDSLTGCEPFESCLLTPIKEESHSHDHTGSEKSKSDFETFVSKCRTKLMGMTSETPYYNHEHSEGCNRRKVNCTMSCSNFSCLRSSTSSDNRCSQEETDSCESIRKYSRRRLQEWRCPYHESDYDCDIGDIIKRTAPQTRECSFSYFHYVVPYKSAFLRRQMQELIQEEAPVYKKEDELLKMYATGSSRGQYINSARGNLTIPWAVRQANLNLNWRNPDGHRTMSEANTPIYTRSVPGIRCPKTRTPSVSVSQTRTLSSLYTSYRPGYLSNISPQMSDYADIPSHGVRSRHLVSGDQARCSNYSSNHWLYSGNADYRELVHRNWNESANNGSDGSSSGDISGNEEIDMGDCDQHGEYLKRSQIKGKPQAGDAAAVANDRVGMEKSLKEARIGQGKQNHYIKQNHNTSLADPHCLCRDHGCMSYDFIHQNYPVARVSNFAARNINGSGNMFGRGLNPSEERLSAMQEHDADSDEEFNSATEELPHYSSSCRKRPKYGRKGQEIDDTCNHPESMSYFMGDGPSGQYDNFEGLPKEDLLINLSPVNADDEIIYCSHHQKNLACQRAPPTEASGQASAGVNKQGRNDCDMHGPTGLGHQLDKNLALAGRSCYGQGDILNKRVFTQWYVDEGEKAQQSQRRPLVSVAEAEKCSHRERWITPSEQCDSSVDDGEEEDDDDEDNDGEDEDDDAEENEDDEEVDEDDEDDDDDDEEDDDENEDDDEEEDDEDENHGIPGPDLCEDERNLKEKPRCLDHMKEKNAQNNYHHEKPQDLNESKIVGHRIVETEQLTKRPTRVRTLTHTKRYATGNKPGHQQSTGDHLTKAKPLGIHEKNMHIKPASGHQHKFSLEQIKVPAIEKERVRFACDENGDWAEIGRGSYGCVYLGLLDGVVEVAIKDFYESSSWDLVIHEARMLMFLQDTGITPKFYGLRRRFDVSKQPSEYCIIMEYFGDGRTLFNVMSDKMVLAGDEWMDIVGQLVAGLRLIHRKNVLINDLKADNILIDLTGGRKIIRYIDVGMATYKQGLTFQLPQDQMSKYNFLAPEVREGSRTTTRSDIYSLGYMLEQMCRMADSTLGGLRKLVARCMEKNPARRPDIDDIVSQVHRFIASKASIMINASSPREQFVLTNSV